MSSTSATARRLSLRTGVAALAVMLAAPAFAQSTVVATINGKPITEADIKAAESEIGSELGQLPELTKRRVLVEYLVDTQLYADAADADKLTQGADYEARVAYWKRRAMRDVYFETKVQGAVKEADAKTFYDDQVKQIPPQEEVRARHILVDGKDKAAEIADKLAKGGDFAALAKEFSKDPGSKETGGDLGFFSKGQMVPQFEEAAFKMKAGEVSPPIETQFGWHVLKVEEKRTKPLPTFDQVKDRIVASLVNKKTQEATVALRAKSKVEFVDAALKKMVDEEQAASKPAAPAEKKP